MKKAFFLGVTVFLLLFNIVQAQDFVPGQIMIDIHHEYLPLIPYPNGQGIITTSLPSIDSLNTLYQVYAFEKLVDDSWSAIKGFYLLKFPDSIDVNLVYSSYSADIHIHLVGLTGFRQPNGVTPSDYYYPQQWGLPNNSSFSPARMHYNDVIIGIIQMKVNFSSESFLN